MRRHLCLVSLLKSITCKVGWWVGVPCTQGLRGCIRGTCQDAIISGKKLEKGFPPGTRQMGPQASVAQQHHCVAPASHQGGSTIRTEAITPESENFDNVHKSDHMQ